MRAFERSNVGGLVVVAALVAGQGCAAVTFQDAKMLGKGNVEFTPTVSRVGMADTGGTDVFGTSVGLTTVGATVAMGVSDKVDLLAGYQGFGVAIGPKVSLVQDRAALIVPVTVWPGLQVSPTAVFSVPLGNGVTLNPGVKVVWMACDECVLIGASVGLSLPIGNRGVLRPEIGMLKSPGESGVMWAFGVGLSLRSR